MENGTFLQVRVLLITFPIRVLSVRVAQAFRFIHPSDSVDRLRVLFLFAGPTANASHRFSAGAFFCWFVRAIFRDVRACMVSRIHNRDCTWRRTYLIAEGTTTLRVRRDDFIRLSNNRTVQAFRVINVSFRLEFTMRTDFANHAGVTIHLVNHDLLYVFLRWGATTRHASHVVIRGVLRRFITDAVECNVHGVTVNVRLLFFI